ncbi:helix-turn-helix domain-containing protein [Paraburkholderia pallida]|uniref:helix-turn-helix domain-containing protein n=1 Tax=Paraburkholderia pallida TaxID=2547399 RepID=UPI001431912A|nr:AraC family transcriptional regulator [Paraburkholderia pallida]
MTDKLQRPVLAVGRWSSQRENPHELRAPSLSEHYTIEVLLEKTRVDCYRDGIRIATGNVGFGATQIAAPRQLVTCQFSGASEAIHVFIPRAVLVAAYEDATQRSCPAGFELRDPCFAIDEPIGRLAHALADTTTLTGPCASLHSESLAIALLARLMTLQGDMDSHDTRKGGLPAWRQRRAVEFMEANLGQQITLQDIAEHTGLSRMHFASQFKLAIGMTPHVFLIHRRLERAKKLLLDHELSLVQVAFEVGFQSQSHFTTVFRRFTGMTPGRWRAQTSVGVTLLDELESAIA